jgi:hypothetical protein
MFVRNAGDEGYCSKEIWDAPFTSYTFRLPWRAGMDSVEVLSGPNQTQFTGTSGTSGPIVTFTPNVGVDVTFNLPLPSERPLIDGALHLRWSSATNTVGSVAAAGPAAIRSRIVKRPPSMRDAQAVQLDDDSERRIRAAINQLPVPQQREVKLARSVARTRLELRPLPPVAPARRVMIAARPASAVLLGSKGARATQKLERDAAQIRALCAAFSNAPPDLPASVCTAPPPR